MSKLYLLPLAALLLAQFHVSGQSTVNDSLVIEKILALPEVKQKNAFIDSFSRQTHGISILIADRPRKGVSYYWVKAGYNGDDRYETYFNFYVYPPKLIIKVLDEAAGTVLTLAEWRQRLHRPD